VLPKIEGPKINKNLITNGNSNLSHGQFIYCRVTKLRPIDDWYGPHEAEVNNRSETEGKTISNRLHDAEISIG
jgi:hypothetical protein